MKVSASNILAGVLLLCLGYCAREPAETVVLTRVDTLAYSAFRDSLKAERLEADGLRAKLAGREHSTPRVILRTDTLVTPPDTVLQLVALDGNGNLALAPLIRGDSLWAPELHRYDVGACDDGWSWASGELVCDRARFGHLALYVEAGLSAHPFGTPGLIADTQAGLVWLPSYRSPWRVFTAMAPDGRLALGVTRSWTLW